MRSRPWRKTARTATTFSATKTTETTGDRFRSGKEDVWCKKVSTVRETRGRAGTECHRYKYIRAYSCLSLASDIAKANSVTYTQTARIHIVICGSVKGTRVGLWLQTLTV